jgi:DNA-binding transcriptional LysR family regulator
MHDLDLTSLRLFVAVCETRNIARAAERQVIVGSAISKRLSALEATVGTPLLQRRRRGGRAHAGGRGPAGACARPAGGPGAHCA